MTTAQPSPQRRPTLRVQRRLRDESPDSINLAEDFHESSKFYAATIARQVQAVRFFNDPDLVFSASLGYRTLPHLPLVTLPDVDESSQRALHTTLVRNRSASVFGRGPVTRQTLGELLWLCYGCYGEKDTIGLNGEQERPRRPVASAGALYPLELYVMADLNGSGGKGLFHYNPRHHALEQLCEVVDHADWVRLAPSEPVYRTAPVVIMVLGLLPRSTFKYGLRGYRFTLLEAGAVIHQAQLAAQALGLASRPYACLYDDVVEELCCVDGTDETFINAILIGQPT